MKLKVLFFVCLVSLFILAGYYTERLWLPPKVVQSTVPSKVVEQPPVKQAVGLQPGSYFAYEVSEGNTSTVYAFKPGMDRPFPIDPTLLISDHNYVFSENGKFKAKVITLEKSVIPSTAAPLGSWVVATRQAVVVFDVLNHEIARKVFSLKENEFYGGEYISLSVQSVSDSGGVVYISRVPFDERFLRVGDVQRWDIVQDEVNEYPYIAQNKLYGLAIDPINQRIIGVNYEARGAAEEPNAPPSSVHIIDARTGEGRMFETSSDFVFSNPRLSPDGTYLSYDLQSNWHNLEWYSYQEPDIRVVPLSRSSTPKDSIMSGHVLDWMGDSLLIERRGELLVYDVLAHKTTLLDFGAGDSAMPISKSFTYRKILVIP